jgi:hypothetical protein
MPKPKLYLDYVFKLEEDGSVSIPDLDKTEIAFMEIDQGMLFEAEIDSEKNSLRFRRKP